jgi:hypothetical protein
MSPPVQKGSDLPVPEDTPLAARHVAGKDVKWTCVACRYQLQHPHLRRAKARRLDRKLFEQLQDGLLKLRQDAEILAEEVEPMLRRRLSIRLSGHTGYFEMIAPEFDRVALLAKLDKAEAFTADFLVTPSGTVQPMGKRGIMLR